MFQIYRCNYKTNIERFFKDIRYIAWVLFHWRRYKQMEYAWEDHEFVGYMQVLWDLGW